MNAQYNTTKLVWVYTTSKQFVQSVVDRGWSLQIAVNSETSDFPGVNRSFEVGRIEDVHGNKLTAPWMEGWSPVPYWGCINNPAYVNLTKELYRTVVSAGGRLIQHDDVSSNVEALSWSPKGCFCDFCDRGFTQYLIDNLSTAELQKLGVTGAHWSYKASILAGDANPALEHYFRLFQTASVVDHYHDVRAYVDEVAGEHVPWSSNNDGGSWAPPIYPIFEAGIAELYPTSHCAPAPVNGTDYRTCTPADLIRNFSPGWALGRQQVLTVPKLGSTVQPWGCNVTQEPWFKLQIRRVTSASYAVGGHMITPYDIYEPDGCPRLYGSPSDYGDVFALVRAVPWLLDGWVNATAFGPDGQGGGGALAANESDVYVYWRRPDSSSPRYGPGLRLQAVLHAVDYRGVHPLPPGSNRGVELRVDLGAVCGAGGKEGASVATVVVYSTGSQGGREVGNVTSSIVLRQEELDPWAIVSVECKGGS